MSNELQELFGGEIRPCTVPFSPIQASTFAELETLPYHGLGGGGLKRRCFELLLSMGYEPRDSETDPQWVLAKRLAKLCPLCGRDLTGRRPLR